MSNKCLNSVIQSQKALPFAQPKASSHLRLYATETRIYYHTNKNQDIFLMASVPSANKGMEEVVCNGFDEVEDLIRQGILVPDIESDKEYIVQRAVGSVDHRTYRLHSEIAARYQFPYEVQMLLNRIENLIMLCDYNIIEDIQIPQMYMQQTNGQKLLEIILKMGTVVRDYQNNIVPSSNAYHYIDQPTFDTMLSRGIIVEDNNKWKLSKKYWEFRL